MRIQELNVSALNPARAISGKMVRDDYDRYDKTRNIYKEILKSHGWEPIGEGYFADVFGNPNYAYVLKIFSKADSAYRSYIDLCKRHSNPYFPQFKGQIMKGGGIYMVIRVEKLSPLPEHRFIKFEADHSDWNAKKDLRQTVPDILQKIEPELVQAFDLINGLGHEFDLHEGNVMQRQDGHIVIIDPVW